MALCSHFTGITAENYAAYITERQEYLRSLPAYYGIELIAYHPLRSIYRPKLFPEKFDDSCCMDFEAAARLIDAIAAFPKAPLFRCRSMGTALASSFCHDYSTDIEPSESFSIDRNEWCRRKYHD